QPALTNGQTLILQFDDVDANGAEFAEVRLSGLSVTLSPALTVEVERVSLSWLTETNRHYQLQYRTAPSSTNWINLGTPVVGTGTKATISDTIPGHERRVYRLRILPEP